MIKIIEILTWISDFLLQHFQDKGRGERVDERLKLTVNDTSKILRPCPDSKKRETGSKTFALKQKNQIKETPNRGGN